MAIAIDFNVRTTGDIDTINNPSFIVRAIRVTNNSGAAVILDNGVETPLSIPPGMSPVFNQDHLVTTFRLHTVTNTTGYVIATVYDSPQDVSNNPALQQAPGTIDIGTGTINVASGTITVVSMPPVDIAPGQTVNVGTLPAVQIAPAQTIGVGTLPAVQIAPAQQVNVGTLPAVQIAPGQSVNTTPVGTTPVSGTFIDPAVAANTGALLGLLTRNTAAFSLVSGGSHTETTTSAIVGFGLTATIIGAGRLNVWVVTLGNVTYLVRDRGFYASPLTRNPIEKRFAIPIALGGEIHVSWDDAITTASFVLRF